MTGRKKGQCCHKKVFGNKTFFCIEPTGHQCAHFYFVTIEDLQYAEAENAALRKLLKAHMRQNTAFGSGSSDLALEDFIDAALLAGKEGVK